MIYLIDGLGKKINYEGDVILSDKSFTMKYSEESNRPGEKALVAYSIYFCGMENIRVIKKGKAFEFKKGKKLWQIDSKKAKEFVEKLKYYMKVAGCPIEKKD